MRILLIDPPTNCFTGLVKRGYPVGLCMLAGVATERVSADVAVYDVDKSFSNTRGLNYIDQRRNMGRFLEGVNDDSHPVWKSIDDRLRHYKPDVVGITTMTIQYASALKVAELVKRWNRKCVVIMGGVHASVMPQGMIEWPHTDIVVRGEGEDAFTEILLRIKDGKRVHSGIPGVVTKEDRSRLNEPPQEIDDLDALPYPDRRALLDIERYSPEDMGLFISSRGCPYRCSYCSNYSRKTRFRSVVSVLEEILEVRDDYGTRHFMFKDDSFTLNRGRTEEFCRAIIERKMGIMWECATRLDLIDDEIVELMKRAGCNRVGVGIESGDDDMLKIYDKRMNREQITRGTKILNDHRMFWTGYFMMGLPMEREEQIFSTLEFMKEIDPPYAALGVYKPYPGTGLFEAARALDIVDDVPSNDLFFKTNPVDYFLKDPRRRCVHIPEGRLQDLISFVGGEFERHNRKIGNIFKRAASRRRLYMRDPKSLYIDVRRSLNWLGCRQGRCEVK